MLPKIVWNALLVVPAALSAALVVTSSAKAADLPNVVDPNGTASELATTNASQNQSASVIAPVELAAAPTASNQTLPIAVPATASTEAPATASTETASTGSTTSVDSLTAVQTPALPTQLAQVSAAQTAPAPADASAQPAADASLQQIMQYSSEGNASQDQVTSISQLSDVQPTDWAFQALQSLVERYGCIAGYPDGTYRGSRPMTRFEFAAGMNACLDRVNELIAAGLQDVVTREDLATLQRLQEEFAAELATLRGRVDAVEARTAELEANQFSTTTVLRGRTIFSLADSFNGRGFLDERNTNTVFQSRVRLNFDTSFTGRDRLRARLQWGNFVSFANLADAGSNPRANDTLFNPQQSFSYASNTNGNVQLSRLEYYFPLGDRTTIYLEAQGASISDIVSSVSSFDDPEQGSLSYFGYNPIYDLNPGRGIGAGATIDIGRNFQLGGGYLTSTGNDPTSGNGLFNGDYAAFGQLTFGLDQGPLVVALTYVNSYRDNLIVNAYGASAQFNISDRFFIGGWASYYDADDLNGAGDSTLWTYAGTVGLSDLGVRGSLLGLIVGVPPRLTEFSVGGTRIGTATQDASLHVEGFYRLPLTSNISVTPGVIWVLDPGNNNDNEDFVTGVIRTSFSF